MILGSDHDPSVKGYSQGLRRSCGRSCLWAPEYTHDVYGLNDECHLTYSCVHSLADFARLIIPDTAHTG